RGRAVLMGIREALLSDPVERGLQLGGQAGALAFMRESDAQVDLHAVAAPPLDQTLECSLDTELIEGRRTQVADQRPQAGDRFIQLLDCLAHGLSQWLGLVGAPGCGEPEPQPAETLQGLVV